MNLLVALGQCLMIAAVMAYVVLTMAIGWFVMLCWLDEEAIHGVALVALSALPFAMLLLPIPVFRWLSRAGSAQEAGTAE